ncbi:MAG: excinuclease ABC subunit A [Candidatus Staskawiczbacteria bacterium RIFCSPHIGHO2_02_FULL_43_16]|uniref:UvrABC system protein A n=1 Tax=Candidatus Staskawiczbacteria bacterium RIFCSPHIGHO2_01_FULL_41_41 TaxID=1802203 RepID=A0A1G2HUL5_9BACT|nr:MAG: excinuclease ABC subunit A [Candidatus Staskawiczbacteria bacterium RIFCSPHIGHO2_01_FULL_41_41]OGZ68209.1 MAG: excinuclease ABC subunit A [Candidatus Staskawiczbacteria bacterium RIFCSPHIGHO2_02_FULL_43_16]OGZ74998.1 MAG: excinuclease ABC subunit A [Candidatus Staskawiczbacteria bacterium RIFCSPLOWO2_01_FULL_43_17b]
MQNEFIKIRGARAHNLKNIDLDIPKNKLVVITGLSGSGKSSLAFDTLYAEGQRRYVESLSAYARQFLGVMDKPDVDKIEGISPAIAIDQRKSVHNPRSTVGTITEIYDYLRLLYARIGKPHCPSCKKLISRQTIDQIVEQVLKIKSGSEIMVLGPVIRAKKGEHQAVLEEIQRAGFIRVRIDGDLYPIEEALFRPLEKNKKHSIEAVVDRLVLPARRSLGEGGEKELDRSRLVDSLETALKLGKGIVIVNTKKQDAKTKLGDLIFSEHFACEDCGISLPELEPRTFSFNNPYGACPNCTGLGEKLEVDPALVMPNKNLSISEGAIFPWSRASHKVGRQGYYFYKLQELAHAHHFSLDVPVKDLPAKIIEIILHGDNGGFEGVVQNLQRRYHGSDSEWTRAEIEQYMMVKMCEVCKGKRLKPEVLAVTVGDKSIDNIVEMPVEKLQDFFVGLQKNLAAGETKISAPITKEIIDRTQFLIDVGLNYLNLDRKAGTLSGGEEQRIRLATQIGSKLSGVLYILDEPSIGLHARDQQRLIDTLLQLRDLGNTVIVVEHDSQTMMASDWIFDIGPGAGKHGGKVMFAGTPKALLKSNTLTGKYLSGRLKVDSQETRNKIQETNTLQKYLEIKGAAEHNLKNIDVKFPLGKFICVTGVSGSGKSSLVSDILAKALLKQFYRAKEEPGLHKEVLGTQHIDKVVLVDQSPIGRTPRSNPATYTGAFSFIRDIFTQTSEAKVRGYGPGRFSFNVKGGRCEACEGQGVKKVEMYFLPDIYVECEECKGKRYSREVLEILYKDKNIADILKMTIEEAEVFFKHIPGVSDKMKTLCEVGLSYVELGQAATSLSGGEAQRIKLATELSRRGTGKTLYILDEPTTGLHFEDIKKLVSVLRSLVDRGNTVLTIEHNQDFIGCVDHIIDLGPEGGERGGQIIAEGSPAEIMKVKKSYTGKYLKSM